MNMVKNPLVYHIIEIKQQCHLLLSRSPSQDYGWFSIYQQMSLTPILPHFVVVCL